MRSALWETSGGALAALLNAGGLLNKADLYTLTLAGGTVLRWSGADQPITGNSQTWALGPGLRRTRCKFAAGVSVDTLTVTFTDNAGTTIAGTPLVAFIAAGGLLGARLQLDRAFWAGPGPQGLPVPVGALLWFQGRAAEVPQVDRYGAQVLFKSDLELLDVMVPRDVYQPGCLNTLYDSACGLAKASFTATGSASGAGSSDRTAFTHGLSQATGYFDLGVVTFTSGPNAGQKRTVKKHTNGSTMIVTPPWPFQVANGNAFSVYAGCDKTQATCTTKFSNLTRFRGQPYVPAVDTIA